MCFPSNTISDPFLKVSFWINSNGTRSSIQVHFILLPEGLLLPLEASNGTMTIYFDQFCFQLQYGQSDPIDPWFDTNCTNGEKLNGNQWIWNWTYKAFQNRCHCWIRHSSVLLCKFRILTETRKQCFWDFGLVRSKVNRSALDRLAFKVVEIKVYPIRRACLSHYQIGCYRVYLSNCKTTFIIFDGRWPLWKL